MKIDHIFNQNHVTAFQSKMEPTKSSTNLLIPKMSPNRSTSSLNLLNKFSNLKPAKPLPSKQFRPGHVLSYLKEHFKNCWEYEKSKSSKLSFYHTIKTNFQKEPYLDTIINPTYRYKTTQLRISAHDLEIETGRYSNTPREARLCKWCLLTLSDNLIEDEDHVLYHCDLYADLRKKLINTLNQTSITHYIPIDASSVNHILMYLLSPNTSVQLDENDPLYKYHQNNHNIQNPPHSPRSYIINAISSYITKCFDKRWSFIAEARRSNVECTTTNYDNNDRNA